MSSFSVIIDTQALVYLTRLGQTHNIRTILPNLFHEILVPTEIQTEFIKGANKEPERLALVDEIKDLHLVRPIKQANFKHCYKEVCRHLGFKMAEKEAHAKTDLKAMGII
jgi:uncharacterized protein YbcC (UPF0753/DUF2309 family)